MAEHKGYIRRGEWDKSGIAAHKENCPNGNVNFDNPTILAKFNARSKRQADLKLDYMESSMIKLHQTGPGKGFNEDEGRRVYTKQWDPLLIQLRKKMGIGAPVWLSASLLGERGGGINSLLGCFWSIQMSGIMADGFIRVSLFQRVILSQLNDGMSMHIEISCGFVLRSYV